MADRLTGKADRPFFDVPIPWHLYVHGALLAAWFGLLVFAQSAEGFCTE